MTLKTADDVRNFWFSEEMEPYWFQKSDDIDRKITGVFGATYEAAHKGGLVHWTDNPRGALSLTIVLDQFPRNMFRGSPRSFESNDLALATAKLALDREYDQETEPTARQFFYLPFMHSEDLADQDRSVALYETLGNDHSLHFAREHRDIIAQFGRFPHRTAVLGRDSTAQETEFLKTHSGF